AAVVAELSRHGHAVALEGFRRAEWRARVRLDATFQPGASTEHPSTGERYLAFVLDELGIVQAGTRAALARWRLGYNPPRGLWTDLEPGAEEALRLARARGLRTGVISNSNGTIADILDELGLARHVEFVLDSSKVGVEKPDPRIFRLALERAGVEPHEAVYVGDLYSIDVLGARAAGLRAILMDPGACWGARDCDTAPSVLAAVRLVVSG
ncbi:MAG TPA: HAD family hydrolase, partial [Methylomirabilota bacterium]|nr:HAD family hydrolase [Methylomirabilota bacterium]